MAVFGLTISLPDPLYRLTVYASILAMGAMARLDYRRLLLVFYNFLVFLLACLVFWPPRYSHMGPVAFVLPLVNWPYTVYGLKVAFSYMFLIINPIVAMVVLLATTNPRDFISALMKLGLSYKAGAMITLGYRYVPIMYGEALQIIEAQSARGLELGKRRNIIRWLRNHMPIFVPLMVRMIRLSVQVAMSMEARCFGAKKKRTFLEEVRFQGRDYAITAACALALALGVYLEALGYGAL